MRCENNCTIISASIILYRGLQSTLHQYLQRVRKYFATLRLSWTVTTEILQSLYHLLILLVNTISAVPVMASSGIEYIWFLVSTFQLLSSSSPTFTSITRKFVPPRSRARKSPTSVETHQKSECWLYILYKYLNVFSFLPQWKCWWLMEYVPDPSGVEQT